MTAVRTRRLAAGDRDLARQLFDLMATVFEEDSQPLPAAYIDTLLARPDFWALAARTGDHLAGGLTAHTLPMTRQAGAEVFIYDIAVLADRQRQGVGRALVAALRDAAAAQGLQDVFVPADNDDTPALDFYRALGAQASEVTFFTFGGAGG